MSYANMTNTTNKQKPLVDYTVVDKKAHSSIFNLKNYHGGRNELVLFDDVVQFNGIIFARTPVSYVNWHQFETIAMLKIKSLNDRLKHASKLLAGSYPKSVKIPYQDSVFYETEVREAVSLNTVFDFYREDEGDWALDNFQNLISKLKAHREWLVKNRSKIPGLLEEAKKVSLIPKIQSLHKTLFSAVEPRLHSFFKKKALRLSAVLVSLEVYNNIAKTTKFFGNTSYLQETKGAPATSDVALDLYEHLSSLIWELEKLNLKQDLVEKELKDIENVFNLEKENLEMGKRCLADYMEKNPSATPQPSFPFPNAAVFSTPNQGNIEKAEGFLSEHLQNNISDLKSSLMTASVTPPVVRNEKPALHAYQKDAIFKKDMALLKDAEKAAGEMIATPAPKLTPVETVKKAKAPVKMPNAKTKAAMKEGREIMQRAAKRRKTDK